MADFSVAGRQFRTQADYKAALRDQTQIDTIKTKVNMDQPGEVITLCADLKAGKYKFTTLVGSDFKEEIQELGKNTANRVIRKTVRSKMQSRKKMLQRKTVKTMEKIERAVSRMPSR